MAARKDSRIKENHRKAIQTSMILKRLHYHIDGQDSQGNPVEMSASQIRAAEILLKKALPDLSSVEHAVENETLSRLIINE